MVTEQEAFRIGFLYKFAEAKISPYAANDAIEVLSKTAGVLVPLAIGTSALLPAILETLIKGGVGIPTAAGSVAGTGLANLHADATDITSEEAMKSKIIADYKAQIRKAQVEKNNKLLSKVVADRKQSRRRA